MCKSRLHLWYNAKCCANLVYTSGTMLREVYYKTVWWETFERARFLRVVKFGKDCQTKNSPLKLGSPWTMVLSIQSPNFKFCQYQLRAVLPNFMLSKLSRYMWHYTNVIPLNFMRGTFRLTPIILLYYNIIVPLGDSTSLLQFLSGSRKIN